MPSKSMASHEVNGVDAVLTKPSQQSRLKCSNCLSKAEVMERQNTKKLMPLDLLDLQGNEARRSEREGQTVLEIVPASSSTLHAWHTFQHRTGNTALRSY